MKKYMFLLMLFSCATLFAQKDTLLDLKGCEAAFLKNNLGLLAAQYNVDAAQAAVIQARLWDNPTFQTNLNAYNPERKKFFDVGSAGEKAFSVQQLILLGGKRHQQVELARTNHRIAGLDFADLLRNLRFQLRQCFFEIYFDQLSYQAVTNQMSNLDTLIIAYQKQVVKGTISPKDLVRLQALYLDFKQQKSDLYTSIIQNQSSLELLCNLKNVVPCPSAGELAVYQKKALPCQDTLINKALENRSDYLMSLRQTDAGMLNLKIQKLQTVPDMTLGLGWDQQGFAYRKDLTLTLGVPLPVLNQNQGRIKMAEAQLKAAKATVQYQQEKVAGEVTLAFKQWKDAQENFELLKPETIVSFKEVENGVLANFTHGNLSLIEFTDFTESYNQTLLQYYRFSKTLIESCERINYTTNTSIF